MEGGKPAKLMLLPTGAGDSRVPRVPPACEPSDVSFTPDSRRIAVHCESATLGGRIFLMDLDGGNARPLGPDKAGGISPIFSPDGKRAAIRDAKRDHKMWPVGGGSPVDLALQPNDLVIQWSSDGLSLYVQVQDAAPARIDRYEIATGRRLPWREIVPTDNGQVQGAFVSRDGRFYAYGYMGTTKSDLYVLDGLQKRLW
jgi:dipeptidyl aminopeptidase/acylaminoacyl peptidase